jgi:predicted nucleotidyltransferase
VDAFALTPAERALFTALNARGVRYLVIGLGAAVLQGAPVSTQDIDLLFERPDDNAVKEVAAAAGGFWVPLQPPGVGGAGLERIDTVLTAHGLDPFPEEYARAIEVVVDGVPVKVLPLGRVVASKRATNRPKDIAALPALEATLKARHGIGDDT